MQITLLFLLPSIIQKHQDFFFSVSKPISMSNKMSNTQTEFSKLKTNDVQKDTFSQPKKILCMLFCNFHPSKIKWKYLFCLKHFFFSFVSRSHFSPFWPRNYGCREQFLFLFLLLFVFFSIESFLRSQF